MKGGVFDRIKENMLRTDDGQVMRAAFYMLVCAAAIFMLIDWREIRAANDAFSAGLPGEVEEAMPVLPPALTEGAPQAMPSELTADMDALRRPMRFELLPGAVLSASGTIDVGAADRFAKEIEQRGEYVKTVLLNSPGGSVDDALAISQAIREKKLGTKVASGTLCASSCPLVLAGGVVREAEKDAIIGVHQVFSGGGGERPSPEEAMSRAQSTTARVSRHLQSMGIAPGLWLHALETPPDRLYYLSAEELRTLDLTTEPLLAAG